MMTYILFVFGFIGISLVITYLWWLRLRVWVLKQDLFEIRDRLWDEAYKKGFLNDEEYKRAREAINGMIRLSHRLCLPGWLYLVHEARTSHLGKPERSNAPTHIPEVEHAKNALVEVVRDYIFRKALSGLIYRRLLGRAENNRAEQEDTSQVIASPTLEMIEKSYSYEPRQRREREVCSV